jgi:predicted MFS family arabinose efflux permease
VAPVTGVVLPAAVATVLAGFGTPPLESCLRVLWPALLDAGRLHAAYALDAAAQEILFVVGPLLLLLPAVLAGDFGVVARLAPAGTLTEAFAWTVTAFGIGNAAGSALAGTLVDASGPAAAFLAGTATAALATATLARRLLPAGAATGVDR